MDTSSGNVDILAQVNGKPRMKKEDLEQIILNVCKLEHKTLDEIGHLIDKAPKYLKKNIIPALVASGKLERLFPNIPNHPNQAYKSAE
jgi:ATP-dependent DNA helicase RecG